MPQIDFYLIARTDLSVPSPGRRQRTVLYQQGHLQGTLLDFGGRFALEPPRGNQHRQAARARLATEKPAVLRRHMPVWTVREAAACGLTEAERAAIVGRSRRFGLSGRAGISSKCEILGDESVSRLRPSRHLQVMGQGRMIHRRVISMVIRVPKNAFSMYDTPGRQRNRN